MRVTLTACSKGFNFIDEYYLVLVFNILNIIYWKENNFRRNVWLDMRVDSKTMA